METGDLRKAFYPTDSHGHLCGQGHLSSRPYLLLYDLSQCLSPLALIAGCPTPHVCVPECPKENYSPLSSATLGLENQETIKTRIRPYCTSDLTEKDLEEKSVQELVHEGQCPPWYISSTPVLGRCLPFMKEEKQ